MPLSKEIIDRTLASKQGDAAYQVIEKLLDTGYEAWWVGGGVRDMLLGEIPKDIDIATSAKPKEIVKLFPKSDESAIEFGSIVVSQSGCTFEVTTFREDAPITNGRHPKSISFTNKEKDAFRRDITINALYWHPISSELFDPFNGEQDLNERLIRFIGDPEKRIQEDALRLLRVIRFRALIDGQYHPETFTALHKRSKDIKILSGTRRFRELEKILCGPHPDIAFEDLWETDVIEHFLPEIQAYKGVGQPKEMHQEGDVWNHVLKLMASFTEDHKADVRFAGLLHDIGKPKTFSIEKDRIHFNQHASVGAKIAGKLLDRLQCPSNRRDKLCWLVAHHMMMGSFFDMSDERKAHWYYHPWFLELLQLFWLDCAGSIPEDFEFYERIIDDYNKFLDASPRPQKPLLSGDEVMDILGIEPGENVGRVLKALADAHVSKEVTTKKEAIAFIKKNTV